MARKKKVLGKDNQGIQKVMRFKDFLGDSTTMFALNTIGGLVGMLTYFYTDKVGISAAVAGSILLFAKIIDAFTDLIMGRLVDHTKSKYGKARPWILWMSLPVVVAIILLFCVPIDASMQIKIGYAVLTNIFATAIVYTAIAVPYNSLMATVTKSVEERSKMGIGRAIVGYISGTIIAILLVPITNIMGGDQRAWISFAVIFGLISGLALINTFLVTKERYIDETLNADGTKEVDRFRTSIVLLFKNKYWVIMLMVMLLINVVYALAGATGIYYVKWVIGNENLMAVLGGIGLIPVILGFSVTGPMIKRFGLTKTTRMALGVGIVGTVLRIIFPADFWAILLFGSFTTFATIPLMAVGGVMVNNTTEYNEWKFGKRMVGMTNSAISFGQKVGSGIGAGLIGWVLAAGNYDATLAVQPTSAIYSIYTLSIYIPGLMLLLIYLLLSKYDLDEIYPKIVKELEERHQKSM